MAGKRLEETINREEKFFKVGWQGVRNLGRDVGI
jgi:hypothetical protein